MNIQSLFTSNNIALAASALAIPSFILSARNYWVSRPHLAIQQLHRPHTACVIEPEFDKEFYPDTYSDRRYRILLEIIIKNKSSNPISLISFNDSLLESKYSFALSFPYALQISTQITSCKHVTLPVV